MKARTQKIDFVKRRADIQEIFTLLTLIIIGLFVASQVLAIVGYQRKPSGFTITNPINFTIFGVFAEFPTGKSWHLAIVDIEDETNLSACFTSSDKFFQQNLPLKEYVSVVINVFTDTNCGVGYSLGYQVLEGIPPYTEPIFEVVEGKTPTFFPITLDLTSGFLSFIDEIFTDISPLFVVGLGMLAGVEFVLPHLINLFQPPKD